jgi:hypothetical protein
MIYSRAQFGEWGEQRLLSAGSVHSSQTSVENSDARGLLKTLSGGLDLTPRFPFGRFSEEFPVAN